MLDEAGIRALLERVAQGRQDVEQALDQLRHLPYEDLEFAKPDHHRALRNGFAEVIYCAGKTPAQVAQIAGRLAEHAPRLLGTRAAVEHYEAARAVLPELQYHAPARVMWLDRKGEEKKLPGAVVVCAGTADMPVAEESALTLEVMGHSAPRIYDVGVAGLHRLLHHLPTLRSANVIVAVAGMEGAMPSVIAGLVRAPVIGVPTSVGYGASFGGLAALLGMLNSCAAGVCAVNIDNGYGAGHLAAIINSKVHQGREAEA